MASLQVNRFLVCQHVFHTFRFRVRVSYGQLGALDGYLKADLDGTTFAYDCRL